ncbi:hypothetical protein H310_15197 [Aphanomyces invadans]|uniref:Tc1-like transposase DDE domain-containing protein n=1 Tax=Aphanomyces invadans TaxID=157072 RepID=A0A024T8P0_9STRA|nr:hypothetical protein H310_15197 [Aphanomyces invadans]ETV89966.1 hypothetical protein H310_15197 [Aphanomyces invadans]|eukprot:XP_008881404.1 hypothetical protein H310_15197 [Aphanomyces invadans]
MAKARGHHVVYSAPGFSELQPIEMVWANVKGSVGRAYTSTTTFQDLRRQKSYSDLIVLYGMLNRKVQTKIAMKMSATHPLMTACRPQAHVTVMAMISKKYLH